MIIYAGTGLLGGLNYDNLVPEVITKAIGWTHKYDKTLTRDMTYAVTSNTYTTDHAKQFLAVIKKEINPFVNTNYRFVWQFLRRTGCLLYTFSAA